MHYNDYQLTFPNNKNTKNSQDVQIINPSLTSSSFYLQNYPYSTSLFHLNTGKLQRSRHHLDDSQMKKILRYSNSQTSQLQNDFLSHRNQEKSMSNTNRSKIRPSSSQPNAFYKLKPKITQIYNTKINTQKHQKKPKRIKPKFANRWGSQTDSNYSLFQQ